MSDKTNLVRLYWKLRRFYRVVELRLADGDVKAVRWDPRDRLGGRKITFGEFRGLAARYVTEER